MANSTSSCQKTTQTLGFLSKCVQESEKPGLKKEAFIVFKQNPFSFSDTNVSASDNLRKMFALVNKRKGSSGEMVEDIPYLAMGRTNDDQTGYIAETQNVLLGVRIIIDPKKSEFTAKTEGEYPSPWWINTLTLNIYGSGHFQEKLSWILANNDVFIVFQDNNDNWRVLGDIDNRVKISAELGSGQGRDGESKTVITAEVESDYPPLYYEGEIRVSDINWMGGMTFDYSTADRYFCYNGLTASDSVINEQFNFKTES